MKSPMKKLTAIFLSLCLSFLFAQLASAADKIVRIPIETAMETSDAKDKLDTTNIKFYFGKQKYPGIQQKLGTDVANKRTNSVGKSDEVSCSRAFVSAMISMQSRAQKLGANAVVNIESYFKKKTYSSNTDFECAVGSLMSAVTLKGDFVKVSGK